MLEYLRFSGEKAGQYSCNDFEKYSLKLGEKFLK
jgi:hypothetical protein